MLTSVLSVGALRAATSLATDHPLYLHGHSTPGDGGEGMFLYNASDTKLGTTREPSSPTAMGIAGITDRGSALQRQVVRRNGKWDHQRQTRASGRNRHRAAASVSGTVWFPAGNHRIDQPFSLRKL